MNLTQSLIRGYILYVTSLYREFRYPCSSSELGWVKCVYVYISTGVRVVLDITKF